MALFLTMAWWILSERSQRKKAPYAFIAALRLTVSSEALLYVLLDTDLACRRSYRTSCDDYTYSCGLAWFRHELSTN